MSESWAAFPPGHLGSHFHYFPLLLHHRLILGADRGGAGQVGAAGVVLRHLHHLQVRLLDRLRLKNTFSTKSR